MAVLSKEDRTFWEENGYVIIKNAAPPELIQNVANAVWDFLEMDANSPESWYTDPPRGIMVEIYQHPALWATRQYRASIKLSQKFGETKNYGSVLTEQA